MTIFCITFAFVLSCWVSYCACEPTSRLYIADLPNERSLHTVAKPRSGGIGIAVALIFGLLGLTIGGTDQSPIVAALAQGALLIALVSLFDDLYGVPALLRMPLHLAAGAWLVAHGLQLTAIDLPLIHLQLPSAIAWPLSLLFVGWMINLYNFMDGMDGFSGSMAVIGFGTLALMGLFANEPLFAAVAMLAAAAAAGFLIFNVPPAHLFMGDTGACLFGFLAAGMTLWGVQENICPLWSALVLFSPFALDATLTLLGRISRLERVWEGERNHYYHWLLMRVGHERALFAHLPVMILCAVVALVGVRVSEPWRLFLTLLVGTQFTVFYGSIVWMARRIPIRDDMLQSAAP